MKRKHDRDEQIGFVLRQALHLGTISGRKKPVASV